MYTIGEVESIAGINASTLRFYEKEGILFNIERNEGGRRIYTEEQVTWLKFVLALKNTGMTIEDIKSYLNMIVDGEEKLVERREFLARHKEKVEKQIAETHSYLERITQKISFYDAKYLKKNYLDL
ncbi:MerR family transcriptional regulator [Paenibacillus peoriae]|uniref:MerR family transcriptional regulator n=1 Tax=Paenibacillus peoriae TaxID=59893 RepID=UPI00026C5B30|nr:MerR family transcriptional regulator [Paenibacillus peoriae]MEC0184642.1 MerR family transcriptional regulator [Paenibacillus peoriae]